jgi:hypothetical protein
MKFSYSMTTEELYQRIMQLANDASDYDLAEQDYYTTEIEMIVDEINSRIRKELENAA